MFEASVERMDSRVTLRAISACHRDQLRAECSVLELAAHFADQNPPQTITDVSVIAHGGRLSRSVREQAMQLGGDGTPLVAEFCIADLAIAMEDSTARARATMAAALDLRHRLPLLWQRVCDGNVRAWMAIKVAEKTRALSAEAAQEIDAEVAQLISTLSWARFEEIIEAKVIAADPERARRLIRRAKDERFVSIAKHTRWGTKTLRARLDADQADQLDAMINKLSGIIADESSQAAAYEDGAEDDYSRHQRLRATGLGRLANPYLALRTLAEDAQPELFPASDRNTASQSEPPAGDRSLWEWLRQINPRKLLPRAILHVHISRDALNSTTCTDAVTRVEGIGPILGGQVRDWLQSCQVTVRPVVDLADIQPVDGYEVPGAMRSALYDRSPFSCYPWSNHTGRRLDADHTQAYRWPRTGDPPRPGQTGLHNLGPLGRSEHRLKTHGLWSVRQLEPGSYVWRTRYGRVVVVNDTGTHDFGDRQLAAALWHAVADEDQLTAA
jgi:hypothetical protein